MSLYKKEIKIFIVLTINIEKVDGTWFAECKELGTSTYGDTFDEVNEEIRELVELHVNTLEKLKERKNFFKEHNITMYYGYPPQTMEVETPLNDSVYVNSITRELACV